MGPPTLPHFAPQSGVAISGVYFPGYPVHKDSDRKGEGGNSIGVGPRPRPWTRVKKKRLMRPGSP